MGGAGFPTGVKLGTDLNGGYILVNAVECAVSYTHLSKVYPKEIP